MNKVVTINLNGRAYQLEEEGFTALEAYLAQAGAKLADDPDKTEIMKDFEQAVAEKCDGFLNANKTVVSSEEITRIIAEMGPVDAPEAQPAATSSEAPGNAAPSPKRLYKIREGAMLAGVCAGIAAYFDIDVTIVRIVFVALTLLSHGPWVLVYIILAVVVPYANTGEERAAAHGMPFNAHEILERAKEVGKESFATGNAWYRKWNKQAHAWHDEHLASRRTMRATQQAKQSSDHHARNAQRLADRAERVAQRSRSQQEYGAHIRTNSSMTILGLLYAAISVTWIVACVQMFAFHSVFGVGVPPEMPLWVAFLVLLLAYGMVAAPIRSARATVYRHSLAQHDYDAYGWSSSFDGVLWLAVWAVIGWMAFTYVPGFREFAERLPGAFASFVESFKK